MEWYRNSSFEGRNEFEWAFVERDHRGIFDYWQKSFEEVSSKAIWLANQPFARLSIVSVRSSRYFDTRAARDRSPIAIYRKEKNPQSGGCSR